LGRKEEWVCGLLSLDLVDHAIIHLDLSLVEFIIPSLKRNLALSTIDPAFDVLDQLRLPAPPTPQGTKGEHIGSVDQN
jgi:hypothetical protein